VEEEGKRREKRDRSCYEMEEEAEVMTLAAVMESLLKTRTTGG
jgi:hypothetical protein